MYWKLFYTFFKIGAFTFGGGWAMISIIEKEVVDKHKWLNKNEFLDALATLGTVLPSFILILLIAIFFAKSYNNPVIERIFKGIRPAVVALIIAPVLTTGKSAKINKYNIWIPASVALLIWGTGLSPIYFVLAGGIGGIFYYRYIKCHFKDKGDKRDGIS